MKVLYEGLVCDVLERKDDRWIIQDKNGNVFRVDESEIVILNNLNENL